MKGYINNKPVEFEKGETILEVARRNGFFIPTLCELGEINHAPGTCRVCLVEIKMKDDDKSYLVTSCNTPMEEGMEVFTRTKKVREHQRLQVELILADHDEDCATCVRHGDCELQDIAQFVGLKNKRYTYPEFYQRRTKDNSAFSIVRDMSKCIRCNRCITVCREVQGTDVLVFSGTGLESEVSVRDSLDLKNSDCVSCGQCTLVCPVGAIAERDDTEEVIDYLYDKDIITVFQFAPAVRVALGEEFGMEPGTNVEGEIITALKKLGADIVLDTNFAADLVIMEEGSEFLERLKKGKKLPLMTSCSPGWINYVEKYYPEFIENISSVKSPQQCFGAIAKNYLSEMMKIPKEKMRVISIMPCTAKKEEAKRDEFYNDGSYDVDVVLTTREFAHLLKREGIELNKLEKGQFDNPWMGMYSGAAEIFGATGGVMEAAVRTVHFLVKGKELKDIDFKPVRGFKSIKEAEISLGDFGKIKIAVANGLKAAKEIIEKIKNGEASYHFIEVMACPGGCLGGGGQPRHKKNYKEILEARKKAIYKIDKEKEIRQSHNNPLIKKLYEKFLGKPLSEKSHKLLHTHYKNRKREIKHTIKEIWDEIRGNA